MKRFFFSTFAILLAVPVVTLAQGKIYSPLVNISKGNDVQSFEQYITFLYGMAISIAALLAVIKIVVAGAKYMLTDVFNTKSEAKSDIQGALLGLLLIMSAVIILELINPTLVKNEGIKFPELQSKASSIKPAVAPSPTPTPQTTPPTPNTTATPPAGGATPANPTPATPTRPAAPQPANTYSCIKGAGTSSQGNVTYQNFNLSSCTNQAESLTYLRNEICKPNPVINKGNNLYYCKQ